MTIVEKDTSMELNIIPIDVLLLPPELPIDLKSDIIKLTISMTLYFGVPPTSYSGINNPPTHKPRQTKDIITKPILINLLSLIKNSPKKVRLEQSKLLSLF